MEEKIIDASWKKNIKIIYPGREVDSYIKNHAILDIVKETKRPCSDMDPFGQDTVLDCMTCSNSDYQIVLKGKTIKEFQDKNSKQKEENKTRYIIEFFEDIPDQGSLLSYLENESSNYRITRDSDGIILRPSLEDRRKKEEEQRRIREDFEALQHRLFAPYENNLANKETQNNELSFPSSKKKKSLLKRIFTPRKNIKST